MAELQKDFLFTLIKSLSKSEKRQFKLYVNRLGINADAKFLLLFSTMDKMTRYDENEILEQKITSKQQISNLKAHLYRQILISLRMNPINQNNRILIREQLDFATILYNKGLYKQSLKLLDKTKQMALELEEKNIAYEIVELEKVIESQYITRSIKSRADDLIQEAKEISRLNVLASKLSNLSLKLYSLMLSDGYAKSEKEQREILLFFDKELPNFDRDDLGFREKLWYFKAQVWKNLLVQHYQFAYRYALSWMQLFYDFPEMISSNPVWFIKGNNYLLTSLFLMRDSVRFEKWLAKFEKKVQSEDFPKNGNTDALVFINLYNAKMNAKFLSGDFEDAQYLVDEILSHKEFHDDKIDEHHILILYFKIASTYFGCEDYENCLKFTDKIIHYKSSSVREDLYFYSRILSIMAMIDSGLDEDYDEFLSQTSKFYKRMAQPTDTQKATIDFFEDIRNIYPSEQKKRYQYFLEKINQDSKNPFSKRNYVYLDLASWLQAKIENKTVLEVIKEKSKNNH